MSSRAEPSTVTEFSLSWRALACLVWLSLLGALVLNIQPVFLGALAEAFSLSAQQLGFLGGVELGGGALASLCAPFWFARARLRNIALFAIIVLVLGNLVTTWVADFRLLLLVRFCCGFFGSGVIYAMSLGLLGQMPKPDRVMAIGIVCQVLSLIIGMLTIPTLLAHWQLPGMTLVLTALFATGLFVLPLIPERSDGAEAAAGGVKAVASIQFLPAALLISMLLFSIGLSGLWAFLERIGDSAGFAMIDIGNGLAIAGLMGGCGALLAAFIDLRFGRLLPLVLGIGGQVGVSLLLATRSDWDSYLFGAAVFSFCWNLVMPYLLGAIASADRSGRCMVLVPAAQAGGVAIGPIMAGLFIVGDGYATAGLFSMVVFALCLILVVPLIRRMP